MQGDLHFHFFKRVGTMKMQEISVLGENIFLYILKVEALLPWRSFDFHCKSTFKTPICLTRIQVVLSFFPWSGLYCDLTTVACHSYHHSSLLRRYCSLEMSYLSFLSVQLIPRIKIQLKLLDCVRPGDTFLYLYSKLGPKR